MNKYHVEAKYYSGFFIDGIEVVTNCSFYVESASRQGALQKVRRFFDKHHPTKVISIYYVDTITSDFHIFQRGWSQASDIRAKALTEERE